METGISKLNIRQRNRAELLTLLRQGVHTRADLAHRLGISRPAVTLLVQHMLDEGILVEKKDPRGTDTKNPSDSNSGRKRAPLFLQANSRFALGITIDRHGLAIGISNLEGELIERRLLPLEEEITGELLLSRLVTEIPAFIQTCGLPREQILGAGLCADAEGFAEQRGLFLAQSVQQALGIETICVPFLEALALAEADLRGKSQEGLLFIRGRAELTAVFVANGKVHAGAHGRGVSFGHMIGGEGEEICPVCGRRGCISSGLGAEQLSAGVRLSMVDPLPDVQPENSPATEAPDPEPEQPEEDKDAFRDTAYRMALALDAAVSSLDPALVVLYGELFENGALYTNLRRSMAEYLPYDLQGFVQQSRIPAAANCLAGCLAAVRELFDQRGGL
ncbi:MAG TPA: ROK family transcriptional regulator [Firmicutes bacterium]|nr:ROK family transcriptional regulator [Bacillota bacterium]